MGIIISSEEGLSTCRHQR